MKKSTSIIFLLIVVALLLYVMKDIDFIQAYNSLENINLNYLILAMLSSFFMFFFWNLRMQSSLKGICKTGIFYNFLILISGVFFNTITPGASTGGEPVRSYFLSKKYHKPGSKFFGVILADKLMHLLMFFAFFIFSLIFLLIFFSIPAQLELLIIITLSIVASIFLLILIFKRKLNYLYHYLLKLLYKLKYFNSKFNNFSSFKKYSEIKLKSIWKYFKSVFNNKKILYKGILFSFLVWGFNFLTSYLLFLSFNAPINFTFIIVSICVAHFIGDVSLIPGGVGLMEGAMFLTYSSLGINLEIAALVTLISRLIYYFYALFIGGLSVIYLKSKY